MRRPRAADTGAHRLPILARGRTADVFADGPGRVRRRYRFDYDCGPEAAVMEHARAHGFPVPRVFDVSGRDLVMERIEGRTMLADLGGRPWRVGRHARLLACLHQRLHEIPPPEQLPVPDWLGRPDRVGGPDQVGGLDQVGRPDRVGGPDGVGGLDWVGEPGRVGGLGGAAALLHLDLHPENVMLSPEGPVVIDWTGAAAGPPLADVAKTWLLIASSPVPGPPVRRALSGLGRDLFLDTFLRRFDRARVLEYLPVVAEHRLSDPTVRRPEREAINRMIESLEAS